ncbi:hypothetical protein GCM10025859_65140 [Alicyclobacillus fastidiosus]|nr:hypothetical protein GCM10025859_65140 [Alicyclobacillus fastidiosus]
MSKLTLQQLESDVSVYPITIKLFGSVDYHYDVPLHGVAVVCGSVAPN